VNNCQPALHTEKLLKMYANSAPSAAVGHSAQASFNHQSTHTHTQSNASSANALCCVHGAASLLSKPRMQQTNSGNLTLTCSSLSTAHKRELCTEQSLPPTPGAGYVLLGSPSKGTPQ
jgi:hypothetical protein